MGGKRDEAIKAFFVIADISGYTKFMNETEITHATGVLEGLFNAVIPRIRPPLHLSGLQGDAVFSYAVASDLMTRQFILDYAEQLYCAFATSRELMRMNTTCPCKACAAIPSLELKVVVHFGECVKQETGGRTELAGADVITAFRLLKNHVLERTGLSAYALISCDALREMGMTDLFPPSDFHTETLPDIGEVEYVAYDLHRAWDERRKSQRVFVEPDETLLFDEWVFTLQAPPDVAFAAITRPDLRQIWISADKIELTGTRGGRIDVGTMYHCQHGSGTVRYEIVDWQPGEYVTMSYRLPMGLRMRETVELLRVGGGTMAKIRFSDVEEGNVLGRLLKPVARRKLDKEIGGTRDRIINRLTEVCATQAAGVQGPSGLSAAEPETLDLSGVVKRRLSG